MAVPQRVLHLNIFHLLNVTKMLFMALMINRNIIEIQTECTAEYTQYSVHQVLCKHSTLHTQYSVLF